MQRFKLFLISGCAALLVVVVGASSASAAAPLTQVTDPANPVVTDDNAHWWHGAAWVDYDVDGDLDLCVGQSPNGATGLRNFLYRNDGGGNFVSVSAGDLTGKAGYWFSQSWGDYDNDGDPDCFFAGYPSALLENNGDGTFTKRTDGWLGQPQFSGIYGAWADYDSDGYLDFCLVRPNWQPSPPGSGSIVLPYLMHNDGPPNYTFTRIDTTVFSDDIIDTSYLSTAWTDYDDDGDIDLIVPPGTGVDPDLVFQNQLMETGAFGFERITTGNNFVTDTGENNQTTIIDYDNDGDLDIYASRWGGFDPTDFLKINMLYRNDGSDYTLLQNVEPITNDTDVTVGHSWGDLDNDGDLDCLTFAQLGDPLRYYDNNGDGTFSRVDLGTLTLVTADNNSGSLGDYDNDGDLDIYVTGQGSGRALIRNDNNNGNSWLKVELKGEVANRSAIGTKLFTVATINGQTVRQRRSLSASDTFFGHNAQIIHFGLGDASTVDSLTIVWPTNDTMVMENISVNQTLSIVQCYDIDNDGLCVSVDPCPEDSANDADADGLCADLDNCPTTPNPDQADSNNDGIGDACCCIGTAGDVNGDGTDANPVDLSALVDYLFAAGTPPACAKEADVNGDGTSADPVDLSFLVDFLFAAGPPPAGC